MPILGILIVLLILPIIVMIAVHAHRKHQERLAALQQLATELHWQYDPATNYDHPRELEQFSIFTTGQSRYAYNTLSGELSIDGTACSALMGDYHYKTTSGSGKKRRTTHHHFSYLCVKVPYVSTPSLAIRREHIFDRVASFIGFDDIDFESAEFSDRFHVKSSDKRFAYAVIHPRMMEFLLADDPPPVDLKGGYCCIYTGACWSAPEFRANVGWVQEFFELWPDHLNSTLQS